MAAISNFLHGPEIVELDTAADPIRSIESSIVAIVGTAGKGSVNTPVLISSKSEGVDVFGAFATDGFTIPSALDALYDQGSPTVVVINVADPDESDYITAVSGEVTTPDADDEIQLDFPYVTTDGVTFGNIIGLQTFSAGATGTITLPAGSTVVAVKSSDGVTTHTGSGTDYSVSSNVITNVSGSGIADAATVQVTYTNTFTVTTHYTLDNDTGVISLTTAGAAKVITDATVAVSYEYLDPTSVVIAAIVGADTSGVRTGVYALLDCESVLGVKPRVICAPGWTHQKESDAPNVVVSELIGENGTDILDKLKAFVVADATDETGTYDDAVTYAADFDSKRVYVVFPQIKYTDPDSVVSTRPASGAVAGLVAKVESDNAPGGYRLSPSNKVIRGILGTAVAIDASLGDASSTANLLNSNRVATIIRRGSSFYLWGNRSTTTDSDFSFLSVTRIFDIVNESIKEAHVWAIDQNITVDFVNEVLERVNAFIRSLISQGVLIDGSAFADSVLNTAESLASGQLYINLDLLPPTPAERITFRSHLSRDYSISEITG